MRGGWVVLLAGLCTLSVPSQGQTDGPVLLVDQVSVTGINSRSTLNRVNGLVETRFELHLANTGSQTIAPPLHVAVIFAEDIDPESTGVTDALGGFGEDPYGTYYLDLSALVGDGLAPGESIMEPVTYYRKADRLVSYTLEAYGVVNQGPQASSLPPLGGITGESVTFNGIQITDPEGDALTYVWDFGDGESSTEAQPSHVFTLPGMHEVILRVTDASGTTTTFELSVSILPDGDAAAGRTRTLDEAGLPLGGVQIIEWADTGSQRNYASSPSSGFVSLGTGSGNHLWKFSKPGYLPVWRRALLEGGRVTVVPNPWLRSLSSQPVELSILGQTGFSDPGGRVQIAFPAGSFENTGKGSLTLLGPQTLPFPLPRGWSPLASFHLLTPQDPVLPGEFSIQLDSSVAASVPLVVARFDPEGIHWVAESILEGNGTNILQGPLHGSGSYAILLADAVSSPPTAVVPEPVPPFPAPIDPDYGTVSISGEARPSRVMASLNPEAVTVEGSLEITAEADVASGFWLPVRIDEIYTLSDNRDVRTPDYDTTIFAYSATGAVDGYFHSSFAMRPQLLFGSTELEEASVRADVFAPGDYNAVILGESGGVLARNGVRVLASSGVLEGLTVAEILDARVNSFLTIAGEYTPVKAFQMNLAGISPGRSLDVSFQPLVANSYYILARLLTEGGSFGLQPVLRMVSGQDGIPLSVEPAGGPHLPGLDRPGQYVLLQHTKPLGIVQGTVTDADSNPAEGVSVRLADSPFAAVTDSNGHYQLLSPEGAVRLTAYNPATEEEGYAEGTLPNSGDSLSLNFTAAPSGPRVVAVRPADNATGVPTVDPVTVTFSKGIHSGTFGPAALTLVPDGTSEAVSGTLGLNLAGTEATFLATNPLQSATTYHLLLSPSIQDASGRPIEGSLAFTFTTEKPRLRSAGAQLSIFEPGAQNVPQEILDQLVGYDPSPGSNHVIAHGSAGTADPEVPVILVNEITGETATVISNPDGSFASFIDAAEEDFISAVFINANNSRITVPATKQLFDDGRQGLYRHGGILEAESDGGPVQVLVEPEAIPQRTVFDLQPVSASDIIALANGVKPLGDGAILAGLRISTEGDQLEQSVKIRIPVNQAGLGLPDGVNPEEATFALTRPREVEGATVYEVIDKVIYKDGYLQTTSPPFSGFKGTTSDPVAMARISFGNSGIITGRVVSSIDGNPDSIQGDHRSVQGAVVFANSAKSADGTVNPGAFVAISGQNGEYALVIPVESLQTTGSTEAFSIAAASGSFPNQIVYSTAVLADGQIAGILPAGKLIFDRSDGDGFFGPDTRVPDIFYSQSLYTVPVNTDVFAEILSVDDRTQPTVTVAMVGYISKNPADPVDIRDIRFDSFSVYNTALSSRVRYVASSSKPVTINFEVTAIDQGGNKNVQTFSVDIGDSDPPPPQNPDPDDVEGPYVLNSRPISGARGVNPFEPITLDFSEPVDPAFLGSSSSIFVLSPDAGTPYLSLSRDQKSLSLFYPEIQPGLGYSLALNAAGANTIRDLSGNFFDQIPGGIADFFYMYFQTEPVLFDSHQDVENGTGAVGDRERVFLLDRRDTTSNGRIQVYKRQTDGKIVHTYTIPTGPYPRDLYLIEDYPYIIRQNEYHLGDLLVVIGGRVVAPDLGGLVDSDIPWIRVYDVTDVTSLDASADLKPLVSIPVRSAIGAALVKLDWSPPLLGVMEIGSGDVHVNLLNLQLLLYSQNLFDTLADEPPTGDPGFDANADGDYTDNGDNIPRPAAAAPQVGWVNAGLVGGVFMPEGDTRRMVDYSMSQGGQLLGAVIRGGTDPPVYRTMLSAGIPTDPNKGELVLDAAPRRILLVMGVPLDLDGQDVRIANLALVTRSGKSSLYVIDISDPNNPSLLVDIPVADDPGETLFTPVFSPDGERVIVASSENLYILDPRKFLLDTANGVRPYITGFLPGGGSPVRRFAADGQAFYAMAAGGKKRIVTDNPVEPVFQYANVTGIDTNTKSTAATIERKSKDALLEIVAKKPESIKGSVVVTPSGYQLPEGEPSWFYIDDVDDNRSQVGLNSLWKVPGIANPLSVSVSKLSTAFNWVPEHHEIEVEQLILNLNVYPDGEAKFELKQADLKKLIMGLEEANKALNQISEANPGPVSFRVTLEKPSGSFSTTVKWAECEKVKDPQYESHKVFLNIAAETKFAPLFGLKGRISIKPPGGVILSFIGNVEAYVEATGSFGIAGKLERDNCGMVAISMPLTGKLDLAAGANISALPLKGTKPGETKYAVAVSVKASTSVEYNFTPKLTTNGITASHKASYADLVGELKVEFNIGALQPKPEAIKTTFLKGGVLIPESEFTLID